MLHRFELGKPSCIAGAFTAAIEHQGKLMPCLTAHLFLKTWYTPLLLKPMAFCKGLRALFGAYSSSASQYIICVNLKVCIRAALCIAPQKCFRVLCLTTRTCRAVS